MVAGVEHAFGCTGPPWVGSTRPGSTLVPMRSTVSEFVEFVEARSEFSGATAQLP